MDIGTAKPTKEQLNNRGRTREKNRIENMAPEHKRPVRSLFWFKKPAEVIEVEGFFRPLTGWWQEGGAHAGGPRGRRREWQRRKRGEHNCQSAAQARKA